MSDQASNPKDLETVIELPVELGPITTPRSGWLVGLNDQGRLLVDYPGNPFGPLRARTTIVLDPTELTRAVGEQRAALLLFEEGDPGRPIIVGLLHDQMPTKTPTTVDPQKVEVEADGKRVEVEAADELVLRCGQASLVLRRNGRVIIRGTYVETRAKGVNRIKGGSVQIN